MENTILHELRAVGGSSVKDTTKNILGKLFSESVAEDYCWDGSAEGRKCFSSLRLKEILFKAVHENQTLRKATDDDIKKVAQEFFKTALEGKRRREKAAQGKVHQKKK